MKSKYIYLILYWIFVSTSMIFFSGLINIAKEANVILGVGALGLSLIYYTESRVLDEREYQEEILKLTNNALYGLNQRVNNLELINALKYQKRSRK